MSFHHFNESKKKTMVILHQRGLHPAHISKLAKGWLDQQNILTMKWPAYSPDLNPIEHVWAWIKAFLHKKKGHITSYLDLEREIRELWDEVNGAMLESLVQSMPRSMRY